jgi:hypothetical protein
VDSIVIGFSKPKSWFVPFSWLIQLVTWCPFSHAYIRYLDSYTGQNLIFQAKGLLVNFIGQTMFDTEESVYAEFSIPVSNATKLTTVRYAINEVGSPYGVWEIFGFAWVLFMRIFGKSVSNPFSSSSSFVCSQLVADVLNEINETDLDSSAMSPKDVYNYLINKGYKPISS